MLRDWGPRTVNGDKQPIPNAFSLGRVQMAFWFLLIVLAFLFVWLVTGDYSPLNTSTLTLIRAPR
jgi:hypothetical protein